MQSTSYAQSKQFLTCLHVGKKTIRAHSPCFVIAGEKNLRVVNAVDDDVDWNGEFCFLAVNGEFDILPGKWGDVFADWPLVARTEIADSSETFDYYRFDPLETAFSNKRTQAIESGCFYGYMHHRSDAFHAIVCPIAGDNNLSIVDVGFAWTDGGLGPVTPQLYAGITLQGLSFASGFQEPTTALNIGLHSDSAAVSVPTIAIQGGIIVDGQVVVLEPTVDKLNVWATEDFISEQFTAQTWYLGALRYPGALKPYQVFVQDLGFRPVPGVAIFEYGVYELNIRLSRFIPQMAGAKLINDGWVQDSWFDWHSFSLVDGALLSPSTVTRWMAPASKFDLRINRKDFQGALTQCTDDNFEILPSHYMKRFIAADGSGDTNPRVYLYTVTEWQVNSQMPWTTYPTQTLIAELHVNVSTGLIDWSPVAAYLDAIDIPYSVQSDGSISVSHRVKESTTLVLSEGGQPWPATKTTIYSLLFQPGNFYADVFEIEPRPQVSFKAVLVVGRDRREKLRTGLKAIVEFPMFAPTPIYHDILGEYLITRNTVGGWEVNLPSHEVQCMVEIRRLSNDVIDLTPNSSENNLLESIAGSGSGGGGRIVEEPAP